MALPSLSEYQTVVQTPALSFEDPQLQRAAVETTPMGLPRALSGGFAITYHLAAGQSEWAVRCFYREVAELQANYRAISQCLAGLKSTLFEAFTYQPQGIRVGNGRYPILKMSWVRGLTLGTYVDRHLNNSRALDQLADHIAGAVRELNYLGIAHGDLQHGNVMVLQNGIRLIDYDGMFVPGMRVGSGHETGHVNYQHPQRDASHFGPEMDRFSSLVIYLSLKALARKPTLWPTYNTGENLILSAADYVDPDRSAALSQLESDITLAGLVRNFRQVCKLPLQVVPSLDEFLQGQIAVPTGIRVVQPGRQAVRRQYDVASASARATLLAKEGYTVEVVGQVQAIHEGRVRSGKPYAFLNFGDWRQGCFTVVIWSEGLERLRAQGVALDALQGKWVSVTGMLQKYSQRNKTPASPQIVLENPANLRVLSDETAADQILKPSERISQQSATATRARNQQVLRESLSDRKGSTQAAAPLSNAKPASSKTRNQAVLQQLSKRPPLGSSSHPGYSSTNMPGNELPSSYPAPPAPSQSSAPSDRRCFIATAAFGAPEQAEVVKLREWRDRILLASRPGRLAVKAYYWLSPPMARVAERSVMLRRMIRWMVRRVLPYIDV